MQCKSTAWEVSAQQTEYGHDSAGLISSKNKNWGGKAARQFRAMRVSADSMDSVPPFPKMHQPQLSVELYWSIWGGDAGLTVCNELQIKQKGLHFSCSELQFHAGGIMRYYNPAALHLYFLIAELTKSLTTKAGEAQLRCSSDSLPIHLDAGLVCPK